MPDTQVCRTTVEWRTDTEAGVRQGRSDINMTQKKDLRGGPFIPSITGSLHKSKKPARGGFFKFWCPNPESNQGHGDFQSPALPTELFGQRGALNRKGRGSSTAFTKKPLET